MLIAPVRWLLSPTPPTRPASVSALVLSCGLARRYTSSATFTFCDGRLSWQFGAQLPMLLASDTSDTVAVPVMWPAALVFMPTCRLVLLVLARREQIERPRRRHRRIAGDARIERCLLIAAGLVGHADQRRRRGRIDAHVAQIDRLAVVDHRIGRVDDVGTNRPHHAEGTRSRRGRTQAVADAVHRAIGGVVDGDGAIDVARRRGVDVHHHAAAVGAARQQ